MIHLIVKGGCTDVWEAASERNIQLLAVTSVTRTESIAEVEDTNEHQSLVTRWFCETDARSCRPGFGYPPGTLLHYTFRN